MVQFFQSTTLFNFFFKAFAITLSFIYLIYAVVIFRQTQIMLRTLIFKNNGVISLISFIQIILAVLLIILAFGII